MLIDSILNLVILIWFMCVCVCFNNNTRPSPSSFWFDQSCCISFCVFHSFSSVIYDEQKLENFDEFNTKAKKRKINSESTNTHTHGRMFLLSFSLFMIHNFHNCVTLNSKNIEWLVGGNCSIGIENQRQNKNEQQSSLLFRNLNSFRWFFFLETWIEKRNCRCIIGYFHFFCSHFISVGRIFTFFFDCCPYLYSW